MQGHSGYTPVSRLVVEGSPEGVGNVDPPFGWHVDIAPGSNLTASADSVWTNAAKDKIAVPTGWEAFKWDETNGQHVSTTNNSTQSFIYTHPLDAAGRILWTFAVSNRVAATFSAGGTVDGTGWFDSGEVSVELRAEAEDGYDFFKWTGDVPFNLRYANPLVLPDSGPRAVHAEFIPEGAAGDIRYVAPAPTGNDTNTGLFDTDPKLTLQAAIADLILLNNGEGTVIVAPGSYAGGTTEITLHHAITVRGATGNPLDVDIFGTGNAEGYNRVFNINHPAARLEGVSVRRGTANPGSNIWLGGQGGTVSNCVIRASVGNASFQDGGGVRMDNGLVTHCWIQDNRVNGYYGGTSGAGVKINGGRIAHCLVTGNATGLSDKDVWAGGIYISAGEVVNCTVAANTCNDYGGVYAQGGRVVNTVIAGNTSLVLALGNPNAMAWGGNPACFTNCFTDTAAPINGGCFARPASELLANIALGDFYPAPGSPLVGAAIPVTNTPGVDLAGAPRVRLDGSMDAGCFQADLSKFAVSILCDNVQDFAPATAGFTALVSGTNSGDNVRYEWNFGDTHTAVFTNETTAAHEYLSGGRFTVTLAATNLTAGGAGVFYTYGTTLHYAPRTLYVWNSVNEPGHVPAAPYDDWTNASRSIQAAVNFAIPGCEIIIRAGTYTDNATADSSALRVFKKLRVRGELEEPDTVIFQATGGHAWRALYINHPDAWVSGITLTGGQGDGNGHGFGVRFGLNGGTVSNCVIRNNHAGSNGWGAGAWLERPNALLTHCVIRHNRVSDNGHFKSVIKADYGRVENCLVHANYFQEAGGQSASVIELSNNAAVRNCTVVDNANINRAVFVFNGGNNFAEHCVVAANGAAPLWVGGNRLLNGNTVDAAYAQALENAGKTDCKTAEPGNIFKDYGENNYRLGAGSPAINAGPKVDPALYPAFDLDGRPRVLGGKIDHGCYEGNPPGTLLLVR
jgi:hypothetical protein